MSQRGVRPASQQFGRIDEIDMPTGRHDRQAFIGCQGEIGRRTVQRDKARPIQGAFTDVVNAKPPLAIDRSDKKMTAVARCHHTERRAFQRIMMDSRVRHD